MSQPTSQPTLRIKPANPAATAPEFRTNAESDRFGGPRRLARREGRAAASRGAFAGAFVLNVLSLYWASVLPAAAVLAAVVGLAVLGAGLGAAFGWALANEPRQAAVYSIAVPGGERRAA